MLYKDTAKNLNHDKIKHEAVRLQLQLHVHLELFVITGVAAVWCYDAVVVQ